MDEFIEKSPEEFNALSAEEQKKYLADKKANDLKVVKETATTAAKEAVKAMEPPVGVSKEDFDTYKTTTTAMIENLGKTAGNKEENVSTIAKSFNDQYEEKMKETESDKGGIKGKITIKAWTSTDTMTVTDVPAGTYPAAGTTGILSGVLAFFTRLIPTFYRKPRPYSKIYNYVTVEPTEGEISATIISEDYVGEAAITEECALKPIVKVDFEPKTINYKYIAVFWKTSRILLRVLAKMGVNLQTRFNELLMEKIPNEILTVTKAGGVAFTADPDFKVQDPNNFDAIVAVLVDLIKKGFVPNAILLSPSGFGKLTTSKASDGHYNLSNGGSIQIIGSTLKYGDFDVDLVQDPKLTGEEFVIGDLTLVKVFIDNQIEYYQGTNNEDDLRRNLVANVLEQMVGIGIPTGAETGIIKDTFANVKNLIAEPEV
ncbi:hypothetical protein CHRYSEOSP005_14870 [Chryseobacterium sp. Alg-005]|uniref:phage major capsid protein n=1 Tax=Chryseobacterium sp. Alg-005 TaxID=3159516 RepID=UPI003555A86D